MGTFKVKLHLQPCVKRDSLAEPCGQHGSAPRKRERTSPLTGTGSFGSTEYQLSIVKCS
jgi:hypothetical protein